MIYATNARKTGMKMQRESKQNGYFETSVIKTGFALTVYHMILIIKVFFSVLNVIPKFTY